MCRGYVQVLRHFVRGTGAPVDLGYSAGTEGRLDIHRVLQPLPSPSETFASPQKETPYPLSSHSPGPLPSPCNQQSAFSLWVRLLRTHPVHGTTRPVTPGAWLQAPASPGGKLGSLVGSLQGHHCQGCTAWSKAGLTGSPPTADTTLVSLSSPSPPKTQPLVVLQLAILLLALNFFQRPFTNEHLAMSTLLLRAPQ